MQIARTVRVTGGVKMRAGRDESSSPCAAMFAAKDVQADVCLAWSKMVSSFVEVLVFSCFVQTREWAVWQRCVVLPRAKFYRQSIDFIVQFTHVKRMPSYFTVQCPNAINTTQLK